MQADKYFKTATLLFYQNKLDEALQQINNSIRMKSTNSLFYSNRSLIHYHMGNISQAKDDLRTAIGLNSNNYVAYFNMFSIECRQGNSIMALNYLEYSLAAMYLIYGKLTKDQQSIMKSVEIRGNFDSLIVLLLMKAQKQQYREIKQILSKQDTNQKIINQMKNIVDRLITNYTIEAEQEFYQLIQSLELEKEHQTGCFKFVDHLQNIQKLINEKLQQFNRLYSAINSHMGTIHKIPKKNLPIQKGTLDYFAKCQFITSH